MPQVLTTNAIIQCPHGGIGTSIPTPPRLVTVNGGEVLLEGDTGVFTTPPCVNIPPCAGYVLMSMGLNATTIQGRRVMLVSDFVQSLTGFPLVKTELHVVKDNTLPGTPPATGAELPPELGEDDQPSVSVLPPAAPFSIAAFGTSGQPVSIPFTFSLSSEYPFRWMLWHVGPPVVQLDVTAGLPASVEVLPSGASPDGMWSGTSAVVVVTVMGTYLATLAPGKHQFVLTGINKRGFSAFAEGVVTVS